MAMWYTAEIEKIVPIYGNYLYFAITKSYNTIKLHNNTNAFYYCTDKEYVYQNYYNDFGPLNLSSLYKYCCKLNKYIEYCKESKQRIVHYTCNNPNLKANAAFLIGCFSVIFLNMNPQTVGLLLNRVGTFRPFLDASQGPNKYVLHLQDCFAAIQKAKLYNLFNFTDFNVLEYDTYDKLQYGDINWIIPRKFLAFVGPTDSQYVNGHSPHFYLKYFLKNDVKTVIRLNNRNYDASVFTQVGIEHVDLIFPDGTTPPKEILIKFLNVVENAPAAIAVHCKAGLGRTGSLIGAYIIKHYGMNAKETIAWLRICRPGSVIGQQQEWLEKLEEWLVKSGNNYRECSFGVANVVPVHKYGIYSKLWPIKRNEIIQQAKKRLMMQDVLPVKENSVFNTCKNRLIRSDIVEEEEKCKMICMGNDSIDLLENQGRELVKIKAMHSGKVRLQGKH